MRNKKISRIIVLTLILSTLLSVSAFADVMGDYLNGYKVNQGAGMTLAKGIYWTGSDYRNENYIEYTANSAVQPMVVYGSKLTNYGSYSSMSNLLESRGYHAIAGINGDYYNMSNFEPLGVVIYEGRLISSDGGLNAVGFRADGSTVMGKPAMKMSVTVGGTPFALAKYNKTRNATDFALLDSEYGSTTKSAAAGFDVICTPSAGTVSMNCALTLTVDEVKESSGAVSIPSGKLVLSLAKTASEDKLAAVQALKAGDTVEVSITSAQQWQDVQFAVGSLYKLVTNGVVETGLNASYEPRTAIGLKPDGTMIMYTVDGRQSGYSIGATMPQVANRLIELGCTEATIMDGGGSTSMNAIYLGDKSISQINKSSGGTQRSVTNYIVLATKNSATGTAAQLAVTPLSTIMLSGAQRSFSAKAADEYGYAAAAPSGLTWSVTGGIGSIDPNGVFTAAGEGSGEVTVSSGNLAPASVGVRVVSTPDSISVKNQATGAAVSSLNIRAGGSIDLTAGAAINHTSLLSGDGCYTWGVTGGIGKIDADGKFTAADITGEGSITVTAGKKTVSIPVKLFQTGSFDDVRTTSWYYDAAEYVNEKGLITGTANRTFSPNLSVSRAMMTTVLWRMAGQPDVENAQSFTDVAADSWYAKAVAWAQSSGVVTGYGDGVFKPNTDVTRQQMAAMLYRYECSVNGTPTVSGSLSAYPDAGKVSAWATDAMNWCISKGIISGIDGKLVPDGTATRAQCAAIVQRYASK